MTEYFMQGFKLLAIQHGGKSTPGSSSSSPHDQKNSNGEAIFSKTGPHNRPHEFKNQTRPTIPKFLESKEGPYTTYDVREAANDWHQVMNVGKSYLSISSLGPLFSLSKEEVGTGHLLLIRN